MFTENRTADLPDVPTIAEAGYPGAPYVQLSAADIPGKPMSLRELAALMKADHNKLTAIMKVFGMTAP